VGGKDVGDLGVAVEAAQADSTERRRRVKRMRMQGSIAQPVLFITTLQRGIIAVGGPGEEDSASGAGPGIGKRCNISRHEAPPFLAQSRLKSVWPKLYIMYNL
jgi:hypothetical protein